MLTNIIEFNNLYEEKSNTDLQLEKYDFLYDEMHPDCIRKHLHVKHYQIFTNSNSLQSDTIKNELRGELECDEEALNSLIATVEKQLEKYHTCVLVSGKPLYHYLGKPSYTTNNFLFMYNS